MKRRFPSLAILIALSALSASTAWAGNAKVKVCHIPPGNPANFHTITISENALQAHLGHGDLAGACFAHCDTLCSDDNACTIDACDANEQCLSTHPPVNCDDGSLCTIDSCNPATGCASVPKICLDGDNCTVDACDPVTGSCVFPAVECPPGQACNPTQANPVCEATLTCVCYEELPAFFAVVNSAFVSCTEDPSVHGVSLNTSDFRGVFAEDYIEGDGACGFFSQSGSGILSITGDEARQCEAFLRARAAAAGVTCQ